MFVFAKALLFAQPGKARAVFCLQEANSSNNCFLFATSVAVMLRIIFTVNVQKNSQAKLLTCNNLFSKQ